MNPAGDFLLPQQIDKGITHRMRGAGSIFGQRGGLDLDPQLRLTGFWAAFKQGDGFLQSGDAFTVDCLLVRIAKSIRGQGFQTADIVGFQRGKRGLFDEHLAFHPAAVGFPGDAGI